MAMRVREYIKKEDTQVYGLADETGLQPGRLTCGFPIFAPTHRDSELDLVKSDEEFKQRLDGHNNWSVRFPFQKYGMVLAGRAVSEIVRKKAIWRAYNQYVVYLTCVSDTEAKAGITALGEELYREYGRMRILRGKHFVTFVGPAKHVTVKLARYASKAEVLCDFRSGSEAMLWDGEHVLMTRGGLLAARHSAVIATPDPEILASDFKRGFDIVIPGLDMSAIEGTEVRLPYLTATVDRIDRSVIHCSRLKATTISEEQRDMDDRYTRLRTNMQAIIGGRRDQMVASAEYPWYTDIFAIKVDLSDLETIVRNIFSVRGIDVRTLRELFGVEIAMKLIGQHINDLPVDVTEYMNADCDIPFEYVPVVQFRFEITLEQWLGAYH